MPANTSPIFTLTPQAAAVAISTANTNRDGMVMENESDVH